MESKNQQWSKGANLGKKLLSKMGWKEGEGIGKDQQGSVTNLKIVKKQNEEGLGFEDANDSKHDAKVVQIINLGDTLQQLSGYKRKREEEEEEEEEIETEEKKLKQKKRKKELQKEEEKSVKKGVRYAKVRNSKNLKNYSKEDLRSVLGGLKEW